MCIDEICDQRATRVRGEIRTEFSAGTRGENHHHAKATRQSIFDGTVPSLTGKDVQLIQPHARPGRLQIFG